MRLVLLVLALSALAPSRARAAGGAPSSRSPGGRHRVQVAGHAIYVDGRRVHADVDVLLPPTWRADGNALAWLERTGGHTRLVVLPLVVGGIEPLWWPLPHLLGEDRVHWAGATRVVVGPALLSPRAVASWSE
jgi:hypothetical protein